MARIDHQVTYSGTTANHQELSAALGWPAINRTFETAYFDTTDLALYRAGAMLRERRQVDGSKATTEAKVPTAEGLERTSGDAARAAIEQFLDGGELVKVATQTKIRTLHFVGHPQLRLASPDVVVALDKAIVSTALGNSSRMEVELQLFTKFPWNSKVSSGRLDRFAAMCERFESEYWLERSAVSGYQAIMPELLQ